MNPVILPKVCSAPSYCSMYEVAAYISPEHRLKSLTAANQRADEEKGGGHA